MVECSLVKLFRLRVAPEMFFVALDAFLRRILEMKSMLRVDNVLNFRMTRRAFLSADFLPLLMALQTVG